MLTVTRLKKLLHYDPETGVWTWLERSSPHSPMWPGMVAGRITDDGRRQIRIDYEFYYAARLAWFYMMGDWPQNEVDHINRKRDDDRWVNLREATRSQNAFNRYGTEHIRLHGRNWRLDVGNWYLGLYERYQDAEAIRDLALCYKKARPFYEGASL